MKRRSFVQSVALSSIGAPLLLKNFNFGAISKQLFETSKSGEDRVLVLIRLNGGNDGLNTLIPLDGYDNLVIQRSNVLIPENQLLNITTTNALHPSMPGMRDMYNSGKLGIIQNVGYPEQNRSHFRSTDIWSNGLLSETASTGWLGRHLDQNYPNFPQNYPNVTNPDPFAISLGYQVSATCQGLMGNFSHTVNNPFDTFSLQESAQLNDGTYYGSHMEYLSTIIAQANDYGARVNTAANAGNTLSTMYDANNDLAVQLRYVAQMISGGLQTKIYVLNINGFDTHDAQIDAGMPTVGNHATLLANVSNAIAAFQDDLALLGLEPRVAGMTFSEFGRQVASNASLGTDHGDAAPLFLFGSCVNPVITGPNPVIGNQINDQAGIPMQIDFRDVYASILKDWFGADPVQIQTLFEHTVTFYPVLGSCNLGVNEANDDKADILIYPNPSADSATVRFESLNEQVTVALYDSSGRLAKTVCSKGFNPGVHEFLIDLVGLESGNYLLTINKASGNFNKRLVKVKHI